MFPGFSQVPRLQHSVFMDLFTKCAEKRCNLLYKTYVTIRKVKYKANRPEKHFKSIFWEIRMLQ